MPDAAAAAPPPAPLFPPLPTPFSHLSVERRWAIVVLHKDQQAAVDIALKVGCSLNTVYHWLAHYREHNSVEDEPRSGRPRLTTPELNATFVAAARAHPFESTPRMLKRKQRAAVSRRTIRRRLNDDSLFGRVSHHFFMLKPEHIRDRLSFGNGYAGWSKEKWMTVLFSDEKIFTLGYHGQVWVQRPKNAAWDPKYCYSKESHAAGINFWCCFSGRGIGRCETFKENNNGKLMTRILNKHLIKSARAVFVQHPPEPWWHLWDNSPIHTSDLCQAWLHNHGVSCIELPPYSPDLNPTEHLLADLARRVEQRFPQDIDELEAAILAEFPLTDVSFLTHLAHSMPKRCQAVIASGGNATKY